MAKDTKRIRADVQNFTYSPLGRGLNLRFQSPPLKGKQPDIISSIYRDKAVVSPEPKEKKRSLLTKQNIQTAMIWIVSILTLILSILTIGFLADHGSEANLGLRWACATIALIVAIASLVFIATKLVDWQKDDQMSIMPGAAVIAKTTLAALF
jgi:hypothetical protein